MEDPGDYVDGLPWMFEQFIIVSMERFSISIEAFILLSRLNHHAHALLRTFLRRVFTKSRRIARKYAINILTHKYPLATKMRYHSLPICDLETDERTIMIPGTAATAPDAFVRLVSLTFICTRPTPFYLFIFGTGDTPKCGRVGNEWWDMDSGRDAPLTDDQIQDAIQSSLPDGVHCTQKIPRGRYVTYVDFSIRQCVLVSGASRLSFLITQQPQPDGEHIMMDGHLVRYYFTHIGVRVQSRHPT